MTSNETVTSFGPLHLFEFEHSRWVRAATEAEARTLLDRGDETLALVKAWADDELFTMMYEDRDGIPDGATHDYECDCTPEVLEEYGCDCEAGSNATTMPAGWWANCNSEERVIYEFQG